MARENHTNAANPQQNNISIKMPTIKPTLGEVDDDDEWFCVGNVSFDVDEDRDRVVAAMVLVVLVRGAKVGRGDGVCVVLTAPGVLSMVVVATVG